MIDIKEYQEFVKSRMRQGGTLTEDLTNWSLGLSGEAGEVADTVKKIVFHDHDFDLVELAHEIGDSIWYAAALCNTIGLDLDVVMQMNMKKLTRRYPDGFDAEKSKNRD